MIFFVLEWNRHSRKPLANGHTNFFKVKPKIPPLAWIEGRSMGFHAQSGKFQRVMDIELPAFIAAVMIFLQFLNFEVQVVEDSGQMD